MMLLICLFVNKKLNNAVKTLCSNTFLFRLFLTNNSRLIVLFLIYLIYFHFQRWLAWIFKTQGFHFHQLVKEPKSVTNTG